MVELDDILPKACSILGASSNEELLIKSIKRGGSGRQISRISLKPEIPSLDETPLSIISMVYSLEKTENSHFIPQAIWLNDIGINAPKILSSCSDSGYSFVEDLGDTDLYSFKQEPWEIRRPLLTKALDLSNQLHEEVVLDNIPLEPCFDTELYLWEQDYFVTHFLGKYLGLQHTHKETLKELREHESLHRVASKLGSLKKCLIHRDFQSQNLMIQEGEVYLIDFQGMRMGRPEYDFASLIYDPYLALSTEESQELKNYAQTISNAPAEHFDVIFYQCAIQRLMQALGAYANLSTQGYTHFEQYIPHAKSTLASLLEQHLNIESLNDFLALELSE